MLRKIMGLLLVCMLAFGFGLAGCKSEESKTTPDAAKKDDGKKEPTTKPSDNTATKPAPKTDTATKPAVTGTVAPR